MCVANGLLKAGDHIVVVQKVKDAFMIKVRTHHILIISKRARIAMALLECAQCWTAASKSLLQQTFLIANQK